MLDPGKMDFCTQCKHYAEVDICNNPAFQQPEFGDLGQPGTTGGGPPPGGGESVLVGGGPGAQPFPEFGCPYFESI